MDSTQSFLDVYPEYRKVILAESIIIALTILILVLLMVQFFRRKSKTPELFMFFRMCIFNLLLAVMHILMNVSYAFLDLSDDSFYIGPDVISDVEEILLLMFVTQWMFFVEYTLHQSLDLIKRRYPVMMIPFFATVSLNVVRIILSFQEEASYFLLYSLNIIQIVIYIFTMFYLIVPYIVLYQEKKRNKIPRYIRLTPTTLCVVVSAALHMFVTSYPVAPVGFAVGLMFADYYMFRRLSYIDPKSGFYIRKVLPVLKRAAKKEKITSGTVIRFSAPGHSEKMAEILKEWEPENSKVITMEDGRFLVLSEPLKASVAECFISLIREQAESEGIRITAQYEKWTGET